MHNNTQIEGIQNSLNIFHNNLKHYKSFFKKFGKATLTYSQSLNSITKKSIPISFNCALGESCQRLDDFIYEFSLLEEHQSLKRNGKKVYKLKKQLFQGIAPMNKSLDNVTKSYKSSQKNWIESTRRLEKTDSMFEQKIHTSTDLYDLVSKHEAFKREAEINRSVFLVNETNLVKEEELYLDSVQRLLLNVNDKSAEVSKRCAGSLDNLGNFFEKFLVTFQNLTKVFLAERRNEAVLKDSSSVNKSPCNRRLDSSEKNNNVLSPINTENTQENIEPEDTLRRNSRIFSVKKLLYGNCDVRPVTAFSISTAKKEFKNDKNGDGQEEEEVNSEGRAQKDKLFQYMYGDITEDLVRFCSNVVSQEVSERPSKKSLTEDSGFKISYSTPIRNKTLSQISKTSVSKPTTSRDVMSFSVRSKIG